MKLYTSLSLHILLAIWTLSLFAQMPTDNGYPYEVSKPYPVIDGKIKKYFSRSDEVMAIKIHGENMAIQKYNATDLKFLSTRKYNDMPDGFKVERIMEHSSNYYFFYSLWNKKDGLTQLFVRELDFTTGTFKGKGRLLITVEGKVKGTSPIITALWGVGTKNKFDFFQTHNESKIIIQYRKFPTTRSTKRNHDIIGLYVFDDQMQQLWGEEFKMPYTEYEMDNISYSIDSEGNAYLLACVYEEGNNEPESKKGKPNYHIELFRIKAQTVDIEILPLDLGGKFIKTIRMKESSEKHMICAGYYNTGEDLDDVDGIIMFKVRKEGAIFGKVTHEIPIEILNQYTTERKREVNNKNETKGEAEFLFLSLTEFIIQEDGTMILIGEQHYGSVPSYGEKGLTGSTTLTYNDILIAKMDTEGKLLWMKKLPKKQSEDIRRVYMSYKYLKQLGDHTLLFMDHMENLQLPPDQEAHKTNGNNLLLTGYRVNDSSGEVTKITFLDMNDIKGMETHQFNVDRIVPISPVNFLLEVYKKDEQDIMIKVGLVK